MGEGPGQVRSGWGVCGCLGEKVGLRLDGQVRCGVWSGVGGRGVSGMGMRCRVTLTSAGRACCGTWSSLCSWEGDVSRD